MNFCSFDFKCTMEINKLLCLGIKERPVLLSFKVEDLILSHALLLCQNSLYSDVFIVLEKGKIYVQLVTKHKEKRCTRGESNLPI